jgi:hypothetical protein
MKHSRKLGVEEAGLGGVYMKRGKVIKSNIKDKTDIEKDAEEKEHTVFYN